MPHVQRPPLLLFVACLAALIVLVGFIGYTAIHNGDNFHAEMQRLEQGVNARLNDQQPLDSSAVRSMAQQDVAPLAQANIDYRKLHHLLALAISGLGVLILLAFLTYRYALILPLRQLERSCREVAETGRGVIWGERDDLFGPLVSAISDLRKGIVQLADMSVETPDGVTLVRFSGRGGAAFNTLISELQAHIKNLQETEAHLREKLEDEASNWQRKVQTLEDSVMHNSANLHDVVELSRQQMRELHGENIEIRGEARTLIETLKDDLAAINQIAAATGQRVAQTLATLSASERDIRQATQQNLQASESFNKHAADLTEKLVAATTLMRASGKVMSETTEAARTRFLEAVQSVEKHEQTLRAFLSDTATKTDQIGALYDRISGSAQHVNDTVEKFDARMGDFAAKSDAILESLAASGVAMGETSAQLQARHDSMANSLSGIREHTDMLARILATIRDDYAGTMEAFRASLGEATPAIEQLKEAGQNIQAQLKQEWAQYAQQSHQLLKALEQDARAMNSRTEQVTSDTAQLIASMTAQAERLGQTSDQLDLRVANLSDRIETAATSVLRSNEQVTSATAAQIGEIHEAVGNMTQRLSMLTQLTGTLGAVAGQLGQLVPILSEAHNLPQAVAPSSSPSPALTARIEQLSGEFSNTLRGMRSEFDTVRTQISRWVETLSSGYQRLAEQIGGIDSILDKKLQNFKISTGAGANAAEIAAKLAPSLQLIHESITEETATSQHMADVIEKLRGDLGALRNQVENSSGTLQHVNELLEQGFSRLPQGAPTPAPAIDVSRVESASAVLENLIASMQGQSHSLAKKLEKITDELNSAIRKIAGSKS